MKKILMTAAVMALFFIPTACNWCFSGCCGGDYTTLVEVESIWTNLLEADPSATPSDYVTTGYGTYQDSADAREFIIVVGATWNALAEAKPRYQNPYGLYACSPPEPNSTHALDSVQLVADADLVTADRTWAAGESLADFFQYSDGAGWETEYSEEISQYYGEEYGYWGPLYLQPRYALTEIFEGRFTVTWGLSDGEERSAPTQLVKLTPP